MLGVFTGAIETQVKMQKHTKSKFNHIPLIKSAALPVIKTENLAEMF